MQEFGWMSGTALRNTNPHHKVSVFHKLFVEMKGEHPSAVPVRDIKTNMIYLDENEKKYYFYISSSSRNDDNTDYTTMPTAFEYLLEKQDNSNNTEFYLVLINTGSQKYWIHPLNDIISDICKTFKDRNTNNKFEKDSCQFTLSYASTRDQYVIKVKPPADKKNITMDAVLSALQECINSIIK